MAAVTNYRIEFIHDGKIATTMRDVSGPWAQGYVCRQSEIPGPRTGMRLVLTRKDGTEKITQEAPELREVSIGVVLGFPSAEQYRAAAKRALVRADEIDALNARLDEMHGPERRR